MFRGKRFMSGMYEVRTASGNHHSYEKNWLYAKQVAKWIGGYVAYV